MPLALTAAALASASVGFLAHNFPPARVFLGDAGSVPLGFLAGVLGLYGVQAGVWPLWFPLLVFSPFIADATRARLQAANVVSFIGSRIQADQPPKRQLTNQDATVTLARRVVRGERFWRAHRDHYYQRLVVAGWSRRGLALAAYTLMALAAASALVAGAAGETARFGIILVWAAAYALLFIAIERRVRRQA